MNVFSGEKPFEEEERLGDIHLLSLKVHFCEDKVVDAFFEEEEEELRDFDVWERKSRTRRKASGERIRAAVLSGMLLDDRSETIWKFQKERISRGRKVTQERRDELLQRKNELLQSCERQLGQWLPDWNPQEETTLSFVMNKKSNFWVDGNKIGADLGRMADQEDFFERTVRGISHELFHVWMFEGIKDKKIDSPREKILYRIADEGLAVFVSGQSIEEHHGKQGNNYDAYKKKAFDFLKEFQETDDETVLRKIQEKGFANMGYFYVVGYEMVREIFEKMGRAEFRKMIRDIRNDPKKMVEGYLNNKKECANESAG